MRINHNISALNTYRQMGANQTAASKNMEKLSSGLKINRAGDDAAGLAISEKMRGQIKGLDMASKNAQDGISMIQTAEGALNETHSILQRMRELAVQAGNDTNNTQDRGEIQKEINQLTSEINRIGTTTEFNTQKLLNGQKDGSTAVAGVFELDVTGVDFTAAGSIVVGGKTFTFDAAGDGTAGKYKDLTTFVTALNNATTGVSGYDTITASGNKLTFTQKTGSESATPLVSDKGTVTTKTEGKAAGTGNNVALQIGANQNQSMSIDIRDMRANALGITGTAAAAGFTASNTVTDGTNNTVNEAALSVATHTDAAAAVTKIQSAIDSVSSERSKLGAFQNRLEHTINNLGTSSENLTAAESRIRDVDMAKEMMEMTKNNILQQAAQAMLAQANQQPQGVLQLLR
ncbi:MAG: flagellin [Bacillus sp. (in: firmicutes)]